MNDKINYEEILKLIGLLEEKNLSQFELEVEGFKIKIARALPAAPAPAPVYVPERTAYPAAPAGAGPAADPALVPAEESGLHFVASPMVGTFYRAPSPTSPPFVEVGDQIKKGQTLCIVEAMKLMNEIDADVDGIIREIYVENAKPVEFGAKLFAIRPL